MKTKNNVPERGAAGVAIAVLLLVALIGGAIIYARTPSLQSAFHSVKESSKDAATTSKVRTAFLLSKHTSPYDITVETKQGEVFLTG
jgi:hypothetical protein